MDGTNQNEHATWLTKIERAVQGLRAEAHGAIARAAVAERGKDDGVPSRRSTHLDGR